MKIIIIKLFTMKRFITILPLLFFMSSFCFGQSVTAPVSGTFLLNTANQDAGNFVVAGFGESENLLVSIGLINPPAGTTLRLSTITGVTASTGYNLSNNFTRISFIGTQANVNTVLASLLVNTGFVAGAINISAATTVNPPGYYYLPSNGHFYKPVTPLGVSGGNEAYVTLLSNAATESFKGVPGYLVTITSQDEQDFINTNVPVTNILIALSDKDTEGVWKWDAGPEAGLHIFSQTVGGSGGTPVGSNYNNWCSSEPNNHGTGEDFTVTNWGGDNCWNDASLFPGISGYVVEFGTWSDPADQTFTEFYSNSVNHQSYPPDPTSITATFSAICNGSSTQLTANGAQGMVYWYTGSCGGTEITSGNPITVSPSETTTYYARNQEGGNYSNGCAEITITVEPVPVSGSLTKTPDVASLCQGNSVSATLSAGSGGNSVDELEYRTNNGSTWSSWFAYSSGSSISTSGSAGIEIRTRRTATTCTSADYTIVSWTVNALLQYRSVESGNWSTPANWEQYNGSAWVAATSYPGQISNDCSSPLVTIQTGHQMEIQSGSDINIPNLEIKTAGKITVRAGGKILAQNQLWLDENAGGVRWS